MKNTVPVLSVVAPSGQLISQGMKKLEIRSWKPKNLPLKNLLIVENLNYLKNDDEEIGIAVAVVDVVNVKSWDKSEVDAACAKYWQDGYYAWELQNIRPLKVQMEVIAKRKIYFVDIDFA